MTNNSLANNLYDLGELMADNLNSVGVSDADVEDGLTTLANKILTVGVEKIPTILTLNTPLVVYTDLFTVTGTLTDDEENPIAEATIQLIWNDGTEHIATGSTNSSGVFSFTSTDPASVSAYSFQLFFAGDSDYAQSNSSVVNVNTAKETSVMVITSPASGSTVSTDSVTVTGTLKDNDGTAMSGKSIEYLLNGSSAGSATVASDGTFSKTVGGLSAGSNSIRCAISATTTHTAANQLITVNRSTFDGLSDLELIDGSQILSYADEQSTPGSQYATIETQLMNGQSAAEIEGVEVEFWDFTDDSSPVFLGSDYSDSAGKASFTYHSLGVGDIPVKAKVGSLLTKTYSLEDCLKVYTGTYLTGTGTVTQALNYNLPSTFEIEYGYKLTSFNQANSTYLRIGETDSKALLIGRVGNDSQYSVWVRDSGDTKHWGSNIQTSNDYQTLTITYDGSSFIFNNDITVTDLKGVNLNTLLNLNGWHDTANQGTITNIKIKPL